ncbi:Gfo/Idh/MocA family protein [Citreimonas salinaria]|uniref:1,5-anhydro-D-fructose reductase (1,5-anhydro-D-mannitol-forming) n=1 Tax=Citreimonas salinaria TaxID=321339 RepID=A0A1H3JBA8_9RHOB|nr:Gfo/Idh/MocA family oxidoreductase [Citreimonas salinaria]SDY36835.1 1,5-anhydro-D-fructose reductase (1,5-anhydro-D-mannitol-forming) [Citreimonas salinaria]
MKWALVGASRIAAGYMIRAFRAQPGGAVTAVLSADAQRGAAYAETHGIDRFFDDLDTLLAEADCDAVYISTTNEKHCEQALAAIAAGKHVLCEKPLAMSVADAVRMVRAAEQAGVVFATNHHLRNAGSHLAIRELVSSGRLGPILSVRVFHAVSLPGALRGWRISDAAAGGGVIPDITVHDADTVRFHLGEDPVEVVAQMTNSGLGHGVEDSAMSIWKMPSGAMVSTHESFTHPFAGTGIEIHGTEGSVVARGVMTQDPKGTVTLTDPEGTHDIPYDTHDLYERSMGLFEAAVRGQGRPSADGWDGVKSLAVALAVREAARTGTAQKIDYGV